MKNSLNEWGMLNQEFKLGRDQQIINKYRDNTMDKDTLKRVKYITKTARKMDANENKARSKAHAKALKKMK